MSATPSNTVKETGAESGDVLVGIARRNSGLLIEVFESQPKGLGGRIVGPFKILHQGSGSYAAGIRAVIDRQPVFNEAKEFISQVSKQPGCSDCAHVVNANGLWKLDVEERNSAIVNDQHETVTKVSLLKTCPKCSRVYTDVSLNFCLEDGSALTYRGNPTEIDTVVISRQQDSGSQIATIDEPTIAINIAQEYPRSQNAYDLYMATRGLWRVNSQRAKSAKYGLAVYQGEVVEVYEITDWEPANTRSEAYWRERCRLEGRPVPNNFPKGRSQFIGHVAQESIRQQYLGKNLPRPHGQNPILYFNC